MEHVSLVSAKQKFVYVRLNVPKPTGEAFAYRFGKVEAIIAAAIGVIRVYRRAIRKFFGHFVSLIKRVQCNFLRAFQIKLLKNCVAKSKELNKMAKLET